MRPHPPGRCTGPAASLLPGTHHPVPVGHIEHQHTALEDAGRSTAAGIHILTKTVKSRGALVMFPVGDRVLGMCSRQKEVGTIFRDKRITR